MSLLKNLKKLILSIDMFSSQQMLRYKNNREYKTVSGGVITIMVITVVLSGFANMIFDTLKKNQITSVLDINRANYPKGYNLTMKDQSKFMFGISIATERLQPLKLNTGPRYFDVFYRTLNLSNGALSNYIQFPLVPCTDEHWDSLPQILQKVKLYNHKQWLCPEIGQVARLEGSYLSPTNYYSNIGVKPCTNSSNYDRPCAPQEQLDKIFQISTNYYFAIYVINSAINPTRTNFIQYFLEVKNYLLFSKGQSLGGDYFFSEYQIKTDNSIWPFSDFSSKKGIIYNSGQFVIRSFAFTQQFGYANIYFGKSQNTYIYTRSVQKISAVFSYIGGLVGAITAVLFLLKQYTASALQFSLAQSLFLKQIEYSPQQKETKVFDNLSANNQFNIIRYISLSFYKILKTFHFPKIWQREQRLCLLQEQILKQLDIQILLSRILALQRCISYIFQEHQIQGIKHCKKNTLNKARSLRQLLVNEKMYGRDQESADHQASNFVKQQKFPDSKKRISKDYQCFSSKYMIGVNNKIKQDPFQKSQRQLQMQQNVLQKILKQSSISNKSILSKLKRLKQENKQSTLNQNIWLDVDQQVKQGIEQYLDIQDLSGSFCLKTKNSNLDKFIEKKNHYPIEEVDPI